MSEHPLDKFGRRHSRLIEDYSALGWLVMAPTYAYGVAKLCYQWPWWAAIGVIASHAMVWIGLAARVDRLEREARGQPDER